MLKITDTVAKVYGNGPHEMLVCIEYSRSLCFHVSKSENKMMGAILDLNAHKIRLAPIWTNMKKQTHSSFKTEVGHPGFHVK